MTAFIIGAVCGAIALALVEFFLVWVLIINEHRL